jgi:hypothetical protein
MQAPILTQVDENLFRSLVTPFIRDAKVAQEKRIYVVNDDVCDEPALLHIKWAPVITLPWDKEEEKTSYFNSRSYFRKSYRRILYVSSEEILYIGHVVQTLRYDRSFFHKRLKNVNRKNEFYVYKATISNFRHFVLEMRKHDMLTPELKKVFIRNG